MRQPAAGALVSIATAQIEGCFSRYRFQPTAESVRPRGLGIEISVEHSLLLPHDEFLFAELNSEGKQQHLRLVFATHEISVRGPSLRRIEIAMQRMELSFLAALSGNQRSLILDGQPTVLEIVVMQVSKTGRRTLARFEIAHSCRAA